MSSRDICWLEYGDIREDKNGNEYGFGVVSLSSKSDVHMHSLSWLHELEQY